MTTNVDHEDRIEVNAAATVTNNVEQPILAFEPQSLADFFKQEGTRIRAEEVDLDRDGTKQGTGIKITMTVGNNTEKSCITNRNVFPSLVLLEMRRPNGELISRNHPELINADTRALLLKGQADQPVIIISQGAYVRLGQAVLAYFRQWRDHEFSNEPLPPKPVI